jgi:DNA-binding protein HU-beta
MEEEFKMNKSELVAAVAEKLAGVEPDARQYVDAVFDTIMSQVAAGDRVQLMGFGTFESVERAARVGHNPRSGATIQVSASVAPRFQAGQTFRAQVRQSLVPSADVAVVEAPAAVEAPIAAVVVAVEKETVVAKTGVAKTGATKVGVAKTDAAKAAKTKAAKKSPAAKPTKLEKPAKLVKATAKTAKPEPAKTAPAKPKSEKTAAKTPAKAGTKADTKTGTKTGAKPETKAAAKKPAKSGKVGRK